MGMFGFPMSEDLGLRATTMLLREVGMEATLLRKVVLLGVIRLMKVGLEDTLLMEVLIRNGCLGSTFVSQNFPLSLGLTSRFPSSSTLRFSAKLFSSSKILLLSLLFSYSFSVMIACRVLILK